MSLLSKNRGLLPVTVGSLWDTDKFFSPSFWDFNGNLSDWNGSLSIPSANITENDKDYKIELAAPGLERKDFKVEVEGDSLVISAEKEETKEEKKDNYRRKEFSYNQFKRSFFLPENSLPEKIDAKYENGILKIVLPKKEITISKPKKEIKVS